MSDRQIVRWLGASSSLPLAALLFVACAGVVTNDDEPNGSVEVGGARANVHASGGAGGTDEGTTTSGDASGAGGQSEIGSGGTNNGTGNSAGASGASGNSGGAGGGSMGAAGSSGGTTTALPFKGLAFEESASNCPDLDRLKVSWYYNWSPATRCKVGAEFVPQVARAWGTNASAATPAKVSAAGYKTVLGFNEPDQAGQANMTVADVLKAWPSFNLPAFSHVGSPATSSSDQGRAWFEQFMTAVQQQGLRVDFIAVHWYGWTTGSCTPTANLLEDYIKWAEQWKKPIWITEWSCHLQSADVSRAFYDGAIVMFKRHPLVERYAWFLSRLTGEFSGAALLDADGNPTALGQDYIAAPAFH